LVHRIALHLGKLCLTLGATALAYFAIESIKWAERTTLFKLIVIVP